jgi:predicted kinase
MSKKQAVVMQGVSGSGKSTYINRKLRHYEVVSADNFFINEDGVYQFNVRLLADAHAACMRDWLEMLYQQEPKICCDNTNLSLWEMAPYVMSANAMGYEVRVIRASGNFKNVHGVPEEAVAAMRRRMEAPPPFWPSTFVEA